MKFENKIVWKTLKWDMGNYRNFLLIDCIVSGDMNNIWGMLRGKITGDMNNIDYVCWTEIEWDMNNLKKSFDYEDEIKKKEEDIPSNIPPEIREAIEIRNEAMAFQKEVVERTAVIEKKKSDYYKKHWTILEKMSEYRKWLIWF